MSRVCAAFVVTFCACAGTHGGAGGGDEAATFRVFYPDAPYRVKVGKRFQLKPVASCKYANGRDARWSMTGARIDGELPAGFTIEDGAISGTPSAPGTWNLKIKFSGVICAGQSHDPQLVDVAITAVAK